MHANADNPGDDGEEDVNSDGGDIDLDADADGDTDDGL
jgi:hypothetical protein